MSTLESLVLAVEDGDEEQAVELARQAIAEAVRVGTIVDKLTAHE